MTEKIYIEFYESDFYRRAYSELDTLAYAKDLFEQKYGRYIYDDCEPFLKNGSVVMEFGCGGGWNLVKFQENGYKVIGYDYSPILTEYGRGQGLDIRQGGINNIEGFYDIIIMNHVVEHFVDLQRDLKKILVHLKPNGIVYIGVPNIENYSKQQFQNAHLFYFSPQTFLYYMDLYGLKQIKFGEAQGIHMYGVFSYPTSSRNDSSLENEYMRMNKVIMRYKIRQRIAEIFAIFGVKKLIRQLTQGIKKK